MHKQLCKDSSYLSTGSLKSRLFARGLQRESAPFLGVCLNGIKENVDAIECAMDVFSCLGTWAPTPCQG